MRLLICGDRNYKDKERIKEEIEALIKKDCFIEVIIEGECGKLDENGKVIEGADLLAREIAEELQIKVLPFVANWKELGKKAGPIRNQQMLDEGRPDYILAFHKNIEKSKGTMDMLQRALRCGVLYQLIK